MSARLKELEVTKVDFVDAGDNKGAHVVLFKRQDETVQKDAETFDEKQEERKREELSDEIWDYCFMLCDSLRSIFWDDDVPGADKSAKMTESVSQFVTAVNAAIPLWTSGTPSQISKEFPAVPEREAFLKHTRARLDRMIAGTENKDNPKGDTNVMRIDKRKLDADELAALEAIEKKAGIPDEPSAGGDTPPSPGAGQEPAPTAKSASAAPAAQPEPVSPAPVAEDGNGVYKGLHPAVAAQIEELQKFKDAAEERELLDVAKKYEIIGKKPEELAPLLKSLKAAGGGQYEQMISVLDASVQAVEKSGLFGEIGKRGVGGTVGGADAWSRIEKHAAKLREADPSMNYNVSIDKACEALPELVREYEENR